MEKQTIIKQKEFEVQPFKAVTIGDPLYLERRYGESRYGKLVFERKALPRSNRFAKVILQLEKTETDEFGPMISVGRWVLKFISVRKGSGARDITETLLSGSYHETLLKEFKELGCDTAKFYLSIDGRDQVFGTGADGYYGYSLLYKNNLAAFFELSFDTALYDEKNMLGYIHYLFEVVSESDWDMQQKVLE